MVTLVLARWMLVVGLALAGVQAQAQSAASDYARYCAGCHTATFRLPSGAASTRGAAESAVLIRDGLATRGMPAFGAQLTAERIEALVAFIRAAPASTRGVGATVEAETLHRGHSANYVLMSASQDPATRFVGFFSERSSLCYDDVDLTGVRSIELVYAKGNEDPGRIAILTGDGIGTARVNLAEKRAAPTGGWETFARHRVGLGRETNGPHLLCIYGLSGGGIFNLDRFTLSGEPGEHDGFTLSTPAAAEAPVFTAAGHRFRLERVAGLSSDPWGMAFLPDGALLVTQKNGQLLMFRDNERVGHIEGTPEVWSGGQGGLMDVKPHPDYARNGWVYLTFSDPGPGNGTSMTRVVRGKLEGLRWISQQDVYRAPERFYTEHYAHFGSRLAFLDGFVYVTIGERQQAALAQDLRYPYGKIHRLHDDGRVPVDNPFAGRADVLPTIWSYGHRNPQGMVTRPDGTLWSSEHGPAGGDELNRVRRGANFGWPLVSFGTHYDGKPVGEGPFLEGVEPPVHHWTPSIAVSQIAFLSGDAFPGWKGQLLVSSLGREELRLIELRGDRVLNDRLLFKGLGRIRDVAVGPDGFPYVLLNRFDAGIYRLRPDSRPGLRPDSRPGLRPDSRPGLRPDSRPGQRPR